LNGVVLPKGFGDFSSAWITHSYYVMPSLYRFTTLAPFLPLIVAITIVALAPTSLEWEKRFIQNKRYAIWTMLLLFASLLKMSDVSVFLYYQF
jgi:hypothetical protein